MKNPDQVFRQLSMLYEFYREIARYRLPGKIRPGKGDPPKPVAASRNGVPPREFRGSSAAHRTGKEDHGPGKIAG
jgi:hypothetical protein